MRFSLNDGYLTILRIVTKFVRHVMCPRDMDWQTHAVGEYTNSGGFAIVARLKKGGFAVFPGLYSHIVFWRIS